MASSYDLGLADLEPSTMQRRSFVDSAGETHAVAVIRVGDTYCAIDDICTHADVSLSEGTLWCEDATSANSAEVECPKHGSLFSASNGAALTFPATQPVATYSVSESGGKLILETT